MENRMDQDKLQVGNLGASILSSSMEIIHGVQSSQSNSSWWVEQPSSAPTSQHYLDVPVSYNFSSTLPCPTTSESSMYPSSYPWEDRYSLYPTSSHSPAVSPRTYPSPPPAYPHTSYSGMPVHNNLYPNSVSPAADDSPISSPESLDAFTDTATICPPYVVPSSQVCMPPPTLTSDVPKYVMSTGLSSLGYPPIPQSLPTEPKVLKKQVRMPQRKGGIQLWQFLYGLLSDSKYSDIIEWTSNRAANEFRMLEPESIAVWWGTIKSKPTMTYDKFSRSLRYYYHKGILKKIPGERYMYRFLVDPEDMYAHIGVADKRPELKSMPKEAKMAMGMFQKHTTVDTAAERLPIVTKPPEGLHSAAQPTQRHETPTSNALIVESFGMDFNNSNNINTSVNANVRYSMTTTLPILIPTEAW